MCEFLLPFEREYIFPFANTNTNQVVYGASIDCYGVGKNMAKVLDLDFVCRVYLHAADPLSLIILCVDLLYSVPLAREYVR